jgi:hypothetical protein
MNEQHLMKVMEGEPQFIGVFAADEVPNPRALQKPFMFIANTAPRRHPGKHWVAFYFPIRSKSEFFDSFAKTTSYYGFHLKNYIHNTQVLQAHDSTVCGYYVLYYLICRARGLSMEDILQPFSKDRDANDAAVVSFLSSISEY